LILFFWEIFLIFKVNIGYFFWVKKIKETRLPREPLGIFWNSRVGMFLGNRSSPLGRDVFSLASGKKPPLLKYIRML
jgi:hypothetical protein